MTQRSVTHATFALNRTYPAKPARVFRAFADPHAKGRWFHGPEGWTQIQSGMDFRIGGAEFSSGRFASGPVVDFRALYQDIVPDERIIYTYEMQLDGKRISVSVATIEFKAEGAGTRLTITEQGAFLDGFDDPKQRELGTHDLLDSIGRDLENYPD